MKVKICCMFLCIGALLVGLGGCGCFMQAQKGEAPPPPPPEAQKLAPPEQKPEVVVTPPPTTSSRTSRTSTGCCTR